jgi:hypothetical protein
MGVKGFLQPSKLLLQRSFHQTPDTRLLRPGKLWNRTKHIPIRACCQEQNSQMGFRTNLRGLGYFASEAIVVAYAATTDDAKGPLTAGKPL